MKISTKVWLSTALLLSILNVQAFEKNQSEDFDFKNNQHKVIKQKVGKRVINTHYSFGALPPSEIITNLVNSNAESKAQLRREKKNEKTGTTKEQRKEVKNQKITNIKDLKTISKPKLSTSYLKDINLFVGKEVYDQGNLGSCTANSLAQIIKYLSSYLSVDAQTGIISLAQNANLASTLCARISRLSQYYYSRQFLNSLDTNFLGAPLKWISNLIKQWNSWMNQDSGASLEDALLAFDSLGCIPEASTTIAQGPFTLSSSGVPYTNILTNFKKAPLPQDVYFSQSSGYVTDLSKVNILKTNNTPIDPRTTIATLLTESQEINPNQASQIATKLFYSPSLNPYYITPRIIQYKNILGPDLDTTLSNIQTEMSKNRPLYMGVLVYSNFYSPDKNGVIGVPGNKDTLEGGHAIMGVGYDSTIGNGTIKFLNSWGSSWNKSGYGFLDQNYFDPSKGLVLSLYSVWLDPSILSS